MGLLPIKGIELFVESFGDGPETVVFTHALFFSGEMYRQQIEKQSKTYRCVTVDWRGMGRSAKPLGGYDELLLGGFAKDPESVADACLKVLYGAPFLENPENAEVIARERHTIVSNDGPVIADGIAGAKLEIMSNIGHQPNVEAPDLLTDLIEAFLS